jgi:hypothetical protein
MESSPSVDVILPSRAGWLAPPAIAPMTLHPMKSE